MENIKGRRDKFRKIDLTVSQKVDSSIDRAVEKPDIFHILNMNIPWIISRPNDGNRDEILKGLTCMIDTRLLNELLIE